MERKRLFKFCISKFGLAMSVFGERGSGLISPGITVCGLYFLLHQRPTQPGCGRSSGQPAWWKKFNYFNAFQRFHKSYPPSNDKCHIFLSSRKMGITFFKKCRGTFFSVICQQMPQSGQRVQRRPVLISVSMPTLIAIFAMVIATGPFFMIFIAIALAASISSSRVSPVT